jgi:hypothetical protein
MKRREFLKAMAAGTAFATIGWRMPKVFVLQRKTAPLLDFNTVLSQIV